MRRGILLALLLLIPALPSLGLSEFYVDLTTKVFVYAIFAIGFDILAGYAGMVSFGHAMFFGGAAYVAALLLLHVSDSFWLALAGALLYNLLLALLVGCLSLRTSGVYFVFLTLIFSQFFFLLAFNWESFLGGDNGLPGIPSFNLAPLPLHVGSVAANYYFGLSLLILVYLIARRVADSPFGRVLEAIRENERRVEAIGYDVRSYKIKAFVISALLSGVGGVLFVSYQRYVSPDLFHWLVSGEIILINLLGGMGTLVGPVLGAVFWIYVGTIMNTLTEHWMIVMGAIYVVFVLFMPEGFMGILRRYGRRRAGPRSREDGSLLHAETRGEVPDA